MLQDLKAALQGLGLQNPSPKLCSLGLVSAFPACVKELQGTLTLPSAVVPIL